MSNYTFNYVVKKATFPHSELGFRTEYLLFETNYQCYPYYPNRFLRTMSKRSENTGKQYAYKLCKFFNYLYTNKGKDYRSACNKDIHDFFYWLSFGMNTQHFYYIQGEQISYSTLNAYHGLLVKFYQFATTYADISVQLETTKKSNQHSFYYGQVWSRPITKLIDDNRLRSKDCRNHHKWYSKEEQSLILSNLRSLRDKAIFSMSCDGLRIGEIITLRIQDYNPTSGYINLFASKGRITGKVNIAVPLSNRSIKYLDDYIFNERDSVVAELFKENKFPIALFLNIKHGDNFGDALSYRNFLTILKRAAQRGGFDAKEIRTHSGRSTAVMDMLHAQSENPQSQISHNDIMQQFRWRSPTSIQPYINTSDQRTQKKLLRMLELQRGDIYDE